MFPHTISVFNCITSENSVTINKCIVKDTFFYFKKVVSQENKGEVYSNVYNCVFFNQSLEKYLNPKEYNGQTDKFTLIENETIIAKGDVNISSLDELNNLNNWFYVKTISDDSDYGEEDLRNIEVTN